MEILIKKETRERKWGWVSFYDIYSPSNTLIARIDGGYIDCKSPKKAINIKTTEDEFFCDFSNGDFEKRFYLSESQREILSNLLQEDMPAKIWQYEDLFEKELNKSFVSKDDAITYGKSLHPKYRLIHTRVYEKISTL